MVGFTNFTQDHLDFFGDMDSYLKAKLALIAKERCGHVVYNADDERVGQAIRALDIPHTAIGIRVPSDIHANDIEICERGCGYQLTFSKRFKLDIRLQLAGVFNVYNSMMAAAMCDCLGMTPQQIQSGLERLKGVPGRIELLETETPYRVILDYAHSPDALENILKTVRETCKGRVIALFGCGGDRDHDKRPIMGRSAAEWRTTASSPATIPAARTPWPFWRRSSGAFASPAAATRWWRTGGRPSA